jgi:hypothetical protein
MVIFFAFSLKVNKIMHMHTVPIIKKLSNIARVSTLLGDRMDSIADRRMFFRFLKVFETFRRPNLKID